MTSVLAEAPERAEWGIPGATALRPSCRTLAPTASDEEPSDRMTAADPMDGAMRRREDPPLLTGTARYTDDLAVPGALQAVFVRAPLAHGRIEAVRVTAARSEEHTSALQTRENLVCRLLLE